MQRGEDGHQPALISSSTSKIRVMHDACIPQVQLPGTTPPNFPALRAGQPSCMSGGSALPAPRPVVQCADCNLSKRSPAHAPVRNAVAPAAMRVWRPVRRARAAAGRGAHRLRSRTVSRRRGAGGGRKCGWVRRVFGHPLLPTLLSSRNARCCSRWQAAGAGGDNGAFRQLHGQGRQGRWRWQRRRQRTRPQRQQRRHQHAAAPSTGGTVCGRSSAGVRLIKCKLDARRPQPAAARAQPARVLDVCWHGERALHDRILWLHQRACACSSCMPTCCRLSAATGSRCGC